MKSQQNRIELVTRPGGSLDPKGAEDEVVVVGADDSAGGGGEDFVVGAVMDKSVGSENEKKM